MSSWFARSSLLPLVDRRHTRQKPTAMAATKSKTNVDVLDKSTSTSIRDTVSSREAKEKMESRSTGLNRDGMSTSANCSGSICHDLLIHNGRETFTHNDLSQISDLTTTDQSFISSHASTNHPRRTSFHSTNRGMRHESQSAISPSGAIGSFSKESETSSRYEDTSIATSLYLAPSRSGRTSMSSCSQAFNRNESLKWRPSIQHLPAGVTSNQSLNTFGNSRSIRLEMDRKNQQNGHQVLPSNTNFSSVAVTPKQSNCNNPETQWSPVRYINDDENCLSISHNGSQERSVKTNMAQSNLGLWKDTQRSEPSTVRESHLDGEYRVGPSFGLRHSPFPLAGAKLLNSTHKISPLIDEEKSMKSELSNAQNSVRHLLGKLEAKERDIEKMNENIGEQQYSFHRRLVSAEECQRERLKELDQKLQQAIKMLDCREEMAKNHGAECESKLNSASTKILAEVNKAEEKIKLRMQEMNSKSDSIHKKLSASKRNHETQMADLRSERIAISKTYSKVSGLLKSAEATVAKISSMAESTLMSMDSVRVSLVESTMPILKNLVSPLVTELLGIRPSTSFDGTPSIATTHVISEIREKNFDEKNCCPKTPKQGCKRELKEIATVKPSSRKRKCSSNVFEAKNLRSKSPILTSTPISYHSIQKERREIVPNNFVTRSRENNLCVTPCEKVLHTNHCKTPAKIIRAASKRSKINRKSFGITRGRMHVLDDDFAFL